MNIRVRVCVSVCVCLESVIFLVFGVGKREIGGIQTICEIEKGLKMRML